MNFLCFHIACCILALYRCRRMTLFEPQHKVIKARLRQHRVTTDSQWAQLGHHASALLQRPASQITSHPSHITTTKTCMQNTKQSYTYTLLDQPLHSVRWVRPCMLQNCSCKGDHLTVPRCMGADRGGCTIATDGTVNGHTCQLT